MCTVYENIALKSETYLTSMFLEILSQYERVLATLLEQMKNYFTRLCSRTCFCCHCGIFTRRVRGISVTWVLLVAALKKRYEYNSSLVKQKGFHRAINRRTRNDIYLFVFFNFIDTVNNQELK